MWAANGRPEAGLKASNLFLKMILAAGNLGKAKTRFKHCAAFCIIMLSFSLKAQSTVKSALNNTEAEHLESQSLRIWSSLGDEVFTDTSEQHTHVIVTASIGLDGAEVSVISLPQAVLQRTTVIWSTQVSDMQVLWELGWAWRGSLPPGVWWQTGCSQWFCDWQLSSCVCHRRWAVALPAAGQSRASCRRPASVPGAGNAACGRTAAGSPRLSPWLQRVHCGTQ